MRSLTNVASRFWYKRMALQRYISFVTFNSQVPPHLPPSHHPFYADFSFKMRALLCLTNSQTNRYKFKFNLRGGCPRLLCVHTERITKYGFSKRGRNISEFNCVTNLSKGFEPENFDVTHDIDHSKNPVYHLNMGNPMDILERHITNRICRDIGVEGWIDMSSLVQMMAAGVGGASLVIEAVAGHESVVTCPRSLENEKELASPSSRMA
ncbi:hypothetical protein J6590_015275 [Homalodisca vitripennis]|nr:hypothetical protein J6590_015275 [Homalodisca vitripennis]